MSSPDQKFIFKDTIIEAAGDATVFSYILSTVAPQRVIRAGDLTVPGDWLEEVPQELLGRELDGKKILIIDDNIDHAQALYDNLSFSDHAKIKVTIASTVEEAKRALENQTFDVIFSDYQLGGGRTCVEIFEEFSRIFWAEGSKWVEERISPILIVDSIYSGDTIPEETKKFFEKQLECLWVLLVTKPVEERAYLLMTVFLQNIAKILDKF